jgi:anti-anti-sigma factor
MTLRIERTDDGYQLAFSGELGIFQVADYHRELLENCPPAARLRVDLTAVDELDSAGLQLLLALEKQVQSQRGSLCVSGQSEAVASALQRFNLSAHFATETEGN